MSLITSATLITSYLDKSQTAAILGPLPVEIDNRQQTFAEVNIEACGGSKFSGHRVFAAGFNYVSPTDLIDWLTPILAETEAVLVVDMEDDMTCHRWNVP